MATKNSLRDRFVKYVNYLQKFLAFWIWRNLAGGAEPFYANTILKKHVAPTPPDARAWFGLKLYLWSSASSYLIKVGELTHYPTLREKF
jgi:hypothetical protein